MKVFTQLTRALPVFRSHAYERMVVRLAAGPVGSTVGGVSVSSVRKVRQLRRVLFVSDVNIGDAILLQPAVRAFRHRFPSCRVEYAFNHKLAALLGPDPRVTASHAVLRSGDGATEDNLERLRELLRESSYDLVISFNPFVTARQLGGAGCPVVTPLGFAIELLRSAGCGEIASMPYRAASWMDEVSNLLPSVAPARSNAGSYTGTRVFLPTTGITRVDRWLRDHGISTAHPVVFVNPDTSNYSTHLGSAFHVDLVRSLLTGHPEAVVIIGRGYTYPGIEDTILDAFASDERRLLPAPRDLDLGELAALIDRSRVYIGGDTGPLHIAAAHKIVATGRRSPVNRTAVIGIFKATEPRIYGYDTHREDMVDSSQDAVAVTVEQRPACKNLTCSMQRISSSCPAHACHDLVDAAPAAAHALSALTATTSDVEDLPATGTLGG
jgi:ADP-heptose:LPS heptosyltransferase